MQRAKVICHMLTSVDGKINGSLYDCKRIEAFSDDYYRIDAAHFAPLAALSFVGRKSAEGLGPLVEDLTTLPPADGSKDLYKDYLDPVLSTDSENGQRCFGVIDPHGRMAWTCPIMQTETGGVPMFEGHRWLEVVVEDWVSAAFLTHCRRLGVPYLFAGKTKFEPTLLLQKVHSLLGANTVRLFGGGIMNGLFLKEKVLDELSILHAPVVSGNPRDTSVFEPASTRPEDALPLANFTAKEVKKLDSGAVWSWSAADD